MMSDSATAVILYAGVDAAEPHHKQVDSVHNRPDQKGTHRLSKAGIGFLLVGEGVEGVCSPVE